MLDPLYIVTQDLDSYFVDPTSGLPLAGGILTFYQDSARTVLKDVFTLTGAPPYNEDSYVVLPNPLTLSNVGTAQDASGNNIAIYYYPYDENGDLSLYYVTCTDSAGNPVFTREAWPNTAVSEEPPVPALEQPGTAGSYLVGWDFPLNPYQFGASWSATPTPPANGEVSTIPGYIIDQTIAASATNDLTWYQDTASGTGGLAFTSAGTNDAFYILQYLSGDTVKKMIGTSMSVNVNGYVFGPSANVTMQIYLFGASTLSPTFSSIPALPTTVGTISPTGTFTLTASGWELIPRGTLPIPNVQLSRVLTSTDVNNVSNNYGFSGYQIVDPTEIVNTNLFAIVVTFAYSTLHTNIVVNSVSLVPGNTPCLPEILTPDETLFQCQYYYQKSFIGSTVPQPNIALGMGESMGTLSTSIGFGLNLGPAIRFPTTMRATPNVTLYTPQASGNQIVDYVSLGSWTGSSPTLLSAQGFGTVGTPPGGSTVGDFCIVNWAADARLGVV